MVGDGSREKPFLPGGLPSLTPGPLVTPGDCWTLGPQVPNSPTTRLIPAQGPSPPGDSRTPCARRGPWMPAWGRCSQQVAESACNPFLISCPFMAL